MSNKNVIILNNHILKGVFGINNPLSLNATTTTPTNCLPFVHVCLEIFAEVIEQQSWQTFTFPAFSTSMKPIQTAMNSQLSLSKVTANDLGISAT